MLCGTCRKVFTNPKGLAKALKQNNNITGNHHDSVEAYRRAADDEGCHVCTLAVLHLAARYPSARRFFFTLDKPGSSRDMIFRLFFQVVGHEDSQVLTFRLYPLGQGTIHPLIRNQIESNSACQLIGDHSSTAPPGPGQRTPGTRHGLFHKLGARARLAGDMPRRPPGL
jgi:hypothetical protein